MGGQSAQSQILVPGPQLPTDILKEHTRMNTYAFPRPDGLEAGEVIEPFILAAGRGKAAVEKPSGINREKTLVVLGS